MTLPLIYALGNASWLTRRRIINLIRNESEKPARVAEVIEFVKSSGGIGYAAQAMHRYVAEADALLTQFPESPHRTALGQLVQYTIERTK